MQKLIAFSVTVAILLITFNAETNVLASDDGSLAVVQLSEEHLNALNRQRRIYVNNDVGYGHPMGPQLSSITPEEWVASRFSVFDQPGCQVDSVGWCLDEGNIAAYPSNILPELQYPTLLRWRDEGTDLAEVIVQESHARGIEAFWEYRVNGADREVDITTPAYPPMKTLHPDWLIEGSWWEPGLWNFAVPEVREHKVAILREVAENYDFDGINLDFGRHPPSLPPGHQWEYRDAMTDFVSQVRLMLQDVAQQRGKPFLLSARVADTVPGCHFDGLDVETWVQNNLVDMIIIGTRSIDVDMTGFQNITKDSHVKMYPCIDQHHSPDGYHAVTAPEFFRGLAANWRHQGADGVATFNFWNELPESASAVGTSGPLLPNGQSVHAKVYQEMGDPAKLELLDKWFVVSRRYGGGWEDRWDNYQNMNQQAPLPLALSADSTWLEVYVADDVAANADRVKNLQLCLQISGNIDPKYMGVKFNGIEMQNPVIQADWWTYGLTTLQMAEGINLLTVRYPSPDASDYPVTLEKVEVHVSYTLPTREGSLGFEDPPYTLGVLGGQGNWTSGSTAIVTDADASEGSQSAMPEGLIATTLDAVYTPTESYRVCADIRLGGGTKGYILLGGAEGFQTSVDKVLEFGFDGGFYAHGANAYTVEGSMPDSDRWVTVWCDLYDAGSGNLMADLGWCELNETPFVDGLRISGYDAADRDTSRLGVLTNSGAYLDNISIGKLLGDANGDGTVDSADAAILAANWQTQGTAVWTDGDFNFDGNVDDVDATILAANWQMTAVTSATVPEPSIFTLLAGFLLSVSQALRHMQCSNDIRRNNSYFEHYFPEDTPMTTVRTKS